MASFFMQAGANVNAGDWAGFSPLHRAAWNGCLEAAEVLLQAGANPNIQVIPTFAFAANVVVVLAVVVEVV